MDLTVWDRTVPGNQGYERLSSLTETYDVRFSPAIRPIPTMEPMRNVSRSVLFAPKDYEVDETDLRQTFDFFESDANGQ